MLQNFIENSCEICNRGFEKVEKKEETFSVKSDVKRIRSDGVEFSDKTRQNFSVIIYATGNLAIDLLEEEKNNYAKIRFFQIFRL